MQAVRALQLSPIHVPTHNHGDISCGDTKRVHSWEWVCGHGHSDLFSASSSRTLHLHRTRGAGRMAFPNQVFCKLGGQDGEDSEESSSFAGVRQFLKKSAQGVTKIKDLTSNTVGLIDVIIDGMQESDPAIKMQINSKAQALLLQRGQEWGPLMKTLYLEDIQTVAKTQAEGRYSNLTTFFRTRMKKLGPTFCAFGHVVMTAHEDVAKHVLAPQKRWDRVYPAVFMNEDFVENGALFTLFLSSEECGGTGSAEILRKVYQEWLNDESVLERTISEKARSMINKLVQDVSQPGADASKIASRFVVEYCHYVVLDMDLSKPEFAALMDDTAIEFFCGLGSLNNHWLSRAWPLNAWGLTENIPARKRKEVQEIYEKSPVVQQYLPKNFPTKIPLSSWALSTIDFMTLAPILGLLGGLPALLSSPYPIPSPEDDEALRDSYFEHMRWSSPVPFTCHLSTEEFYAEVNGERMKFPPNTPIAVGVGLTAFDEKVFPNPEAFNPANTRKCPFSTAFNWVGETQGPRSCPGRHIAERAGKDVLIARYKIQAARKDAVPVSAV
eukprot:TRINITY_DN1563_c0_g1_i2.p1 TRINITY_DN1563_c0_g1~~TRINITY_DN1563_c0_g1_i2.p1  ORF type:complete len:554 (-),score=92.34 TRINITY_DN1563_c0_g1_i2:21-1682(-)